MGSEEPLFVLALIVITLIMVAILVFIPVKIVQLLVRDCKSRRMS
jgi:hypothetical protein